MSDTKRILPADAFDTLEFSAFANGGIGQPNVWNVWGEEVSGPCCIWGHSYFATKTQLGERNPIRKALGRIGIEGMESDCAVMAINHRLNRPLETRVSFKQWCAELGVVRGK